MKVVEVEWQIRCAAIDALPAPLFENVFADFVSGQGPLLILDAADIRILHELGVKTNQFLGKRRYGGEPTEAVDDRQCCIDARLEAWRQPALRLSSVVEPRGAVAEVG